MTGAKGSANRARALAIAAALAAALSTPAPPAAQEAEARGAVTNRPIPRYVSLKAPKANMRRGPGLDHRVDWVLVRKGMPLRIIAEYGHWRRVQDMEGEAGWVHYSMLSGARTAVVRAPDTVLRADPDGQAPITARAEPGVILRLDACDAAWCEAWAQDAEGWVAKSALWGVGPDEVFD